MSGYGVTARYYDPMASAAHAHVDERIAGALAGLNTAVGPVVDVGAGTGLTTALIAGTLPAAEVVAVEPDPAMLPALMTRVWANPDLRKRVTILPSGILEALLPDRIAGAVLSASLVHLGPPERARLWPLLAERLAPGGRIIVEVQCPSAEDMAEVEIASARVGRVTYRGSAEATQVGPDRQRWRMTYRADLEGRTLACDTASYECWAISADQVVEEAALAGLHGRREDELVILEHASA